jgi:hypothetical protein
MQTLSSSKWDGGTAEDLVKILHSIEEQNIVDLQSLLKGATLMSVFAGDANKMLIIRQCIQASSDVLESFEQSKYLLKTSLRSKEDDEDETAVAASLLKAKIKFLTSLKKDDEVELPMITDAKTGYSYPDFTPAKAKRSTSSIVKTTKDDRRTIVRNLSLELETADFGDETLIEAKFKIAESKSKKNTSHASLKAENDKTLLIYYRVLVKELLIEVMTGTLSSQTIDFAAKVAEAKTKGGTVADSNDLMERVRALTYTRISNMIVPNANEMLAFTRKLKPELNTYLWFAKIYGTDEEVKRLRRDIHNVLAGKLDHISAEAGMSLSMNGQCDARVQGGTMTKYDYYVEFVEGIARAKGSSKPTTELPKPAIRLVQGASAPTSDDNHALVNLPNAVDALQQAQILLAGALSKNPEGQAVLEKLSQLKSTLSETYFTKKSDETQKPITDPKSDSKSQEKKKKRSAQKSDSESDSDEPTTKTPKRKEGATARYTVAEFKELLKITNAHEQIKTEQKDRSKICYNYQKGNCTRGATCHFDHVKEQSSRRSGPAPCYKFKQGRCSKNDCTYSHAVDKDGAEPKKHRFADLLCENTIKKGFCDTQSCRGKHGKWSTSGEVCKAEERGKVCPFLTKPGGCKFKHVKCTHTST